MLILHDPATLRHRTVEILGARLVAALECPERVTCILHALEADGRHPVVVLETEGRLLGDGGEITDPLLAQLVHASHDRAYLEHLGSIHAEWVARGHIQEDESVLPECFPVAGLVAGLGRGVSPPLDSSARPGFFAFDMSSGIGRDTWLAACASANLAVGAVQRVVSSNCSSSSNNSSNSSSNNSTTANTVLALCRPPGHHCTTRLAGGYCYLNNAVVAVHALRHWATTTSSPSCRVAILDLDFHHGNGTQAYFYGDSSVLHVSIHGRDEYPYYSGHAAETGQGSGTGFNVNLPVPPQADLATYLSALDTAVARVRAFAPDYLLLSLGFDTFHADPLGAFGLQTADYETIARRVHCPAAGLAAVPTVVLLEGGYVLESLGANLLSFLQGWEAPLTE